MEVSIWGKKNLPCAVRVDGLGSDLSLEDVLSLSHFINPTDLVATQSSVLSYLS